MATSIGHLLATSAGLATLCIVTAMSGNGWGDDKSAAPNTREDLMQWHSVLVVPRGSCMKQDWNSALSATSARDATPFPAAPGAVAFGETMDSGCDPASDSHDASANARQPAHGAIGNPGRSILISR